MRLVSHGPPNEFLTIIIRVVLSRSVSTHNHHYQTKNPRAGEKSQATRRYDLAQVLPSFSIDVIKQAKSNIPRVDNAERDRLMKEREEIQAQIEALKNSSVWSSIFRTNRKSRQELLSKCLHQIPPFSSPTVSSRHFPLREFDHEYRRLSPLHGTFM